MNKLYGEPPTFAYLKTLQAKYEDLLAEMQAHHDRLVCIRQMSRLARFLHRWERKRRLNRVYCIHAELTLLGERIAGLLQEMGQLLS